MHFQEVVAKIKSLEIQGAERIAKAAVQAFAEKLKETQDKNKLEQYANQLRQARETEPGLRNSLRYCLENYQKDPNITTKVIKHFEDSKIKIKEYGAKKIHSGMNIFTHCHSSTVTGILLEAKKQGKKFKVFNSETRPRYQGRKTAQELAEADIEVHHFIDSAARLGLKKADLFLFGCDSISAEGRVINKIGTYMLLEFANKYDTPAFSCTNSWKFNPETVFGEDEEIENRNPNEVWENPPKNIVIHNPAFEAVAPDKLTGIISELGVMKPESLITAIKENYPWLI